MHHYPYSGGNVPSPYGSPPFPRPQQGPPGTGIPGLTPGNYILAQPTAPGPPAPAANPMPGPPPHAQPASAEGGDIFPPCPENFPEIQRLPLEELRNLANDPAAFDSFIDRHPHTRSVQEKAAGIKRKIVELEAQNKKKQEEFAALSRNDAGMTVEELLEIETKRHTEAKQLYDDWLSRNSHPALIRRLEEEKDKVHRESKEMSQRFLEGQIPYDDFVDSYIELRKRYHDMMMKVVAAKSRSAQGQSPLAAAQSNNPSR